MSSDDNANSQPAAKKQRGEGLAQDDVVELVAPSRPLEERLSLILRCTVCLDLSVDIAVYQVSHLLTLLLALFSLHSTLYILLLAVENK